MAINEAYENIINSGDTPAYVFDTDKFAARAQKTASALGDNIPLCYSIKANPFLIKHLPSCVQWLEVCSPGELTICENTGIDLGRIIFSGVNKTQEDVERAMADGVGIFTAESLLHAELINDCAVKNGKTVPIILRLSCGNQFGMDESDIRKIICGRDEYKGLDIKGLHYYTGTQKKKAAIIRDELAVLEDLIESLKKDYGFCTDHVEYGPGLACDYFGKEPEETDMLLLSEASEYLREFAQKYPLSIEMGRFLASDCGSYLTKIMDTKVTHGINYAICDGGINHLKYYGQTMAMQVPHITVYRPVGDKAENWSLCGSLCTTADVLVRKAELTGAGAGSVLVFDRAGAYSVTEGLALFLSRPMPNIYIYSENGGLIKLRGQILTDPLNTPKF